MKTLIRSLAVLPALLMLMGLGSKAIADRGELDHEQNSINRAERIKDLPPTLVIRVNETTKTVEVANLATMVANPQGVSASALKFMPVKANQAYSALSLGVAELDRDNSRESWYFTYYYSYPYAYPSYYYPVGYSAYAYGIYPTYSYYGYTYNYYPYAAYTTPYYSYYYYTPYAYYYHRRW